jgi:hypothetical protein
VQVFCTDDKLSIPIANQAAVLHAPNDLYWKSKVVSDSLSTDFYILLELAGDLFVHLRPPIEHRLNAQSQPINSVVHLVVPWE